MVLYLRGIGKTVILMEMGVEYLIMDRCTKESGWMVKCRAKECFSGKMVLLILVNGITTSSTVMVTKNGRMVQNMREILWVGSKRVTEF